MDSDTPVPADFGIPDKSPGTIRVVTFNVNGFNTLFNYHPWNRTGKLKACIDFLHADIVTLQELKVSNVNNSVARVEGFYNYVTIPKQKKGYAGVGVYVRRPTDQDLVLMQDFLTVRKVEEGISGYLECLDYPGKCYKDLHDLANRKAQSTHSQQYRDAAQKFVVGGYCDLYGRERCLELDSQGRCVVVELGCGVVVISLYCPANSQATEDGEVFRLEFLLLVAGRVRRLEKLGKRVLVLGDINVALDLIDSADGVQAATESDDFEAANSAAVAGFCKSTVARVYMNSLVYNSNYKEASVAIDNDWNVLLNDDAGVPVQRDKHEQSLFLDSDDEGDSVVGIREVVANAPLLHDLVRLKLGRQLRLYTCWNTLKNHRSINYGSRIDLILGCESISAATVQAGILPKLHGSDHCPVFADVDVAQVQAASGRDTAQRPPPPSREPRFEAKYVYGLTEMTIMNMFQNFTRDSILGKRKPEEPVEVVDEPEPKKSQVLLNGSVYVSRKLNTKKQASIASFFRPVKTTPAKTNDDELLNEVKKEIQK